MTEYVNVGANGLAPGFKYNVRVRGIFNGVAGEWSGTEEIDVFSVTSGGTGDKAPAAVTALTVTPTIDSFIITWNAPTLNADGTTLSDMKDYVLEVSDVTFGTADATYIVPEHNKPSDLSAVDRAHQFEFTYKMNKELYGTATPTLYVRIYARDTTNNRSAAATANASNSAPTAPGTPSLTPFGGGISASWTAGGADTVQYVLRAHTASMANPPVTGTEVYRGTVLNFSHITTGTKYYRVGAVDIFGQTTWSNEASATALVAGADTTPPAAPTSLADAWQGTSYVLTWTAPADIDVVRYQIDIRNAGNTATRTFYSEGPRFELSLADNAQAWGGTAELDPFYVRVWAIDAAGNISATYNEITGAGTDAAPANPGAPTLATPVIDAGGIYVGITAPSDPNNIIDSFEINGTATGSTTVIYTGNATFFRYALPAAYTGTYYFRARTKDKFGRYSSYGTEVSIVATSTLTAPTSSVAGSLDPADPSNRTGILTVSAISGPSSPILAGYKLRYKKAADSNWTEIDVNKTATTYVIKNIPPGVSHNVEMASYDVMGRVSGTWVASTGSPVTVTADTSAGSAPTSVALASGATSLNVTWTGVTATDVINTLGRYEVEIATDVGFTTGNLKQTQPGGTASQNHIASFTGLTPATTYWARVRAIDAVGNVTSWAASTPTSLAVGSSGNPSDGNVPSTNPTPTAISGIGGIHLRWTAISNADPVTYEVHVGTTAGFTPSGSTMIGEISGTYFFAKVDGGGTALAYGTDYYFKLRSKDVDGPAASYGSASGAAQVSRVNGGSDITDGTVTGTKLVDATITAAKIGALIGGGNILSNSSFELDANADGTANDWTPTTSGTITAAQTISTAEKIYGASSQRINLSASTTTGYRSLDQSGTMPAGAITKMTLSFWYKGARTGTGQLNVVLSNSGVTSFVEGQYTPTSTWQRGSLTWTVPGADTTWRVQLRSRAYTIADTCDVYLDGVQLEVGDVVTAYAPKPDEILDGSITAAKITAGTITADRLSIGTRQAFQQAIYDDTSDLNQWNLRQGSIGNITVQTPTDAILGGSVFRNTTNIVWMGRKDPIPFDPTTLYKLTVKARRTATVGTNEAFYFGLEGYAGDKTTLVNTTGANTYSNQHYGYVNGSLTVGTSWTTIEMFYQGTSGTPTTGRNSISNPSDYSSVFNTLHTNVKYVAPMFISNYNGGAGTLEIGSVVLEAIQPDGIIGTSIADGTIATANIAANAITATQLAAGAVTANKLNVVVGGGNIVANSSFESWSAGVPTSWTKNANVTLTQVTGRLGTGSAARFTSTTAANDGVSRFNQSMTNKFEASSNYVVSGYVKRNSGTGNLNVAVDGVGTFTLAGTATNPVVSTSWQRFNFSFTTPASPSITIGFFLSVANDVFEIDDFQIERGDVVTAYAPITDEILPGTIVTSQISAGGISADVLTSGTINAGTVAVTNLNASNISSGTLDANRIATASLSADKVLIGGSASNMIPVEFADFEATSTLYDAGQTLAPAPTGTSPGTIATSATQVKFGSRSLAVTLNATNQGVYLAQSATTYNIPMVNGKKYIVSAYVYTNATQNVTLRYKYSGGGPTGLTMVTTSATLNSWTRVYGTFTAPADGMANISVQFANTSGTQYIDGVMMEEQLGGATTPGGFLRPSTVIDGANVITGSLNADRITAGSIDTTRMTANTINGDRISAGTLLASKIAVATGVNLVDPAVSSFELNTPADAISPYAVGGQVEFSAIAGTPTWTTGTTRAIHGLSSLEVTTQAAISDQTIQFRAPYIPVVATKRYLISAYVYQATGGTRTVTLRGIGDVSAAADVTSGVTSVPTGAWTRVWGIWTAGASDALASIQIKISNHAASANVYYVDAVQFEEILSTTGTPTGPSTYTYPSSTYIDGSGIITGSITGDQIAANSITADMIATGALNTQQLGAVNSLIQNLILGADETGQRVEADGDGLRVIDASGNLLVDLPTDPNKRPKFNGDLIAQNLEVIGATILGTTSVGQGTSVELESVQAPPGSSPAVSIAYPDTITLGGAGANQKEWFTLSYNANGGTGLDTPCFYTSRPNGQGYWQHVEEYRASDGVLLRTLSLTISSSDIWGVTTIGSSIYILYKNIYADYVLAKYNISNFANTDSQVINSALTSARPGLGTDGTDLYVVCGASKSTTANLRTLRYNTNLALQTNVTHNTLTVDTEEGGGGHTTEFGGIFKIGSLWYIPMYSYDGVSSANTRRKVYVFSGTITSSNGLSRLSDNDFFGSLGAEADGIAYDGASVYTVLENVGITKHTDWLWTSGDSSTYWVGYSWRDDTGSAVACTFQVGANTVTKTTHGLANGDVVVFKSVTSTTGISTDTAYYVVNAATDTFQVALTAGGGAIDLTGTDGSGTYEGPVSGSPHETAVSARTKITARKRAGLKVTTTTIPGTGGAEQPNAHRVYINRGTTEPVSGSRFDGKLQGTNTLTTNLLTSFNTSGASNIAAGTFPGGTPAKIESAVLIAPTQGSVASVGWSMSGSGTMQGIHPDIQTFTTTGSNTWYMPVNAGYTEVEIIAIGGGGAGGAGGRNAASNAAGGGGGGAGAAACIGKWSISSFNASEAVVVGAGGTTTAGRSSNGVGADGAAGTDSTVTVGGTIRVRAKGGGGGSGGGQGSGPWGAGGAAPGQSTFMEFAGISGGEGGTNALQTAGGDTPKIIGNWYRQGGAGGGGGGGITGAGVLGDGMVGGSAYNLSAGTAGSGNGGAGASNVTGHPAPGSGGGGGAGRSAGAGYSGGAGGLYGGGGGGGGGVAGGTGNASGDGGAGGNGIVVIICR